MSEGKQRGVAILHGDYDTESPESLVNALRFYEETQESGFGGAVVKIIPPKYTGAMLLSRKAEEAVHHFRLAIKLGKLVDAGQQLLCLGCNHEFVPGRPLPAAFSERMPLHANPERSFVRGICEECAEMQDERLQEIFFERLEKMDLATSIAQGGSV